MLDAGGAAALGQAPCGIDHLRREIGGDDAPAGSHALGGEQARVADTARELQHGVAGLKLEPVDEVPADRLGRFPLPRLAALPG